MKATQLLLSLALFGGYCAAYAADYEVPGRWPTEKAEAWYALQPWLVGCNYIPAHAINQLEMWQAETFDPQAIEKELALAQSIGFNSLRIFLHDLVWEVDPAGLYGRMERFLALCDAHGIRPLFVFFDDCHRPLPKLGKQPLPVPAYHNSGWMNSPARDVATAYANGTASERDQARLKGYVQETMRHFKDDPRILMWDLYNEPGRGDTLEPGLNEKGEQAPFGDKSAKLLLDVWRWAREVNPSQPLTSCADGSVGKQNIAIGLANSDILSFHNYNSPEKLEADCVRFTKMGRPVLCTEYMARPNSTFAGSLPILKKHKIGAYNWGFVAGKTGCIWPWSSRKGKNVDHLRKTGVVCDDITKLPEPEIWFHELFRPDHSPYRPEEVEFIRQITKENRAK